MPKYKLQIIVGVCLFIAAVILRLVALDSIPPGINGDEVEVARSGQMVLQVKGFSPFVNSNEGHATLIPYLVGISTVIFGKTVWAIRLPSVIFGALDVTVFYFFLSLFFRRKTSIVVSIIFMCAYSQLVLSRLAFEVSAMIFFEILVIIFLFQLLRSQKVTYGILTGSFLGIGLYSYLGFRTFVFIILVLQVILLFKKKLSKKLFGTVILSCLVVALPLLHYSMIHPNEIMFRTSSLSVFQKDISLIESLKEIGGSISRLPLVVFGLGDPNPRANPGQVSIIDSLSFLVALAGGVFLYKKNKSYFWIMLFLAAPFVVNDIFSLERIPEGHYYGFGHPNTLRIAGIIPMIYFFFAYGWELIARGLSLIDKLFSRMIQIVFIFMLCFLNIYNYFGQPSEFYFLYNYHYNEASVMKIIDMLNKSSLTTVYLSPSVFQDVRIQYFLSNKIQKRLFAPVNTQDAIAKLKQHDLTVFAPEDNMKIAKDLQETKLINNALPITNPAGTIDFVIFSK